MILGFRYLAKTYTELSDIVRPKSGDEPECIPWVWYDTQQYAAAGATFLTFYGAAQADITLSNIGVGVLETLQYFEIHKLFTTIMSLPTITTTAVITGSANDVALLHFSARGVETLTMVQKVWGPFPLDFFGRPGGPEPFVAAEGTETAPARNILQFGQTVMNGGFPGLGALTIPPVTNWRVRFDFATPAVPINAATNLRHAMMGTFHRRVT